MTIDGWDQKCMDVVSRAELLAQKKIAERQVREHLLRYYERIRGHLTTLCGDLQDGNTSSRQKQIQVKSEYNQIMRNYDTADPVQNEAEIVTILKTITELEKGAQNSDLDDILANALEDLQVQLRTVNKNVVEQKLVLNHRLTDAESSTYSREKIREQDVIAGTARRGFQKRFPN